jgi:hypothetical protein
MTRLLQAEADFIIVATLMPWIVVKGELQLICWLPVNNNRRSALTLLT